MTAFDLAMVLILACGSDAPAPAAHTTIYATGAKITLFPGQRIRVFSPAPPSKLVQVVVDQQGSDQGFSIEAERLRIEERGQVTDVSIDEEGRLKLSSRPMNAPLKK